MRNGKYQNGRRSFGSKSIAALLAVILILTCVVGGTIAWLTDETEAVVNTFTVGDINITLEETTEDFKMIPGFTIDKDPIVTVKAGSEDCWVFVQVEESDNLDDYIEYEVDKNNWTELEGVEGVYYTFSKDVTADRPIKDLLNNQVSVLPTVTKEMMEALKKDGAVQPTLTFTAYAVQLMKNNTEQFTPAEAWAAATAATTTAP